MAQFSSPLRLAGVAVFASLSACNSDPIVDLSQSLDASGADAATSSDAPTQDVNIVDGSTPDATGPDATVTDAAADVAPVDGSTPDTSTDASNTDAAIKPDAAADAATDAAADAKVDAKTCVDKCTLSTQQCSGNGYTTCQLQANGCTDWAPVINCAPSEYCSAGQCVTSCLNQCTSGTSKCASTTSVSTCGIQTNGCTEWNTATACPPSQSCVNGACKSTSPSLGWKAVTSGSQQELKRVWGSAYNDIFAVGKNGTILHYDGVSWSPMASGTSDDLIGVWGSGPKDVWAIESAGLRHYDGTKWSTPTQTITGVSMYDVNGTSASDAWILGQQGSPIALVAYRFDGASWTKHSLPSGISWGYSGNVIAPNGANRAWAAGNKWQIAKYNGTSWTATTGNNGYEAPTGIVNVGTDKFWLVGYQQLTYCDGATCSNVAAPAFASWKGIARVTDTDLWTVGSGGKIARYNGQGWALSGTGVSTAHLYGVWASGPDDAWAVGETGTILHYSP